MVPSDDAVMTSWMSFRLGSGLAPGSGAISAAVMVAILAFSLTKMGAARWSAFAKADNRFGSADRALLMLPPVKQDVILYRCMTPRI